MSGIINALTGSGRDQVNVTTSTPPPSAEEQELIRIATQIAQSQLNNINALAPFQRELLEASLAGLRSQTELDKALGGAISPADQAALLKANFEREKKLGPIQDQILEMQLANMRGELTPAQQAAVDAQIKAGFGDIDTATSESLGIISDEVANSRGLRLSDSPIMREAGELAKHAIKQKASFAGNLRAQALFQMPGQSAGIGLAQQQLAEGTKQFQAQLRQQAAQNRMALTGQSLSSGIGLATAGGGAGSSALSALSGVRTANTARAGWTFSPANVMGGHAQFGTMVSKMIGGIGGAMAGG